MYYYYRLTQFVNDGQVHMYSDTAHGSDTVTVLRRVDALQDFIQEGESMTSDLPEINLLKQEVKKAKAWNHKLALAGLDSSSVAASNGNLNVFEIVEYFCLSILYAVL